MQGAGLTAQEISHPLGVYYTGLPFPSFFVLLSIGSETRANFITS